MLERINCLRNSPWPASSRWSWCRREPSLNVSARADRGSRHSSPQRVMVLSSQKAKRLANMTGGCSCSNALRRPILRLSRRGKVIVGAISFIARQRETLIPLWPQLPALRSPKSNTSLKLVLLNQTPFIRQPFTCTVSSRYQATKSVSRNELSESGPHYEYTTQTRNHCAANCARATGWIRGQSWNRYAHTLRELYSQRNGCPAAF